MLSVKYFLLKKMKNQRKLNLLSFLLKNIVKRNIKDNFEILKCASVVKLKRVQ